MKSLVCIFPLSGIRVQLPKLILLYKIASITAKSISLKSATEINMKFFQAAAVLLAMLIASASAEPVPKRK